MLLGLTLVSAGVLERGYVLCRSGDGEARVEAAAVNGSCGLSADKAVGCSDSSASVAHQPGHRCGGCEDVTISSGTVSSSTVRASFSPDAQILSVVPQVLTWILSTLLPTSQWLPSTPRLMPVSTAFNSDIAQVRQTIILVI